MKRSPVGLVLALCTLGLTAVSLSAEEGAEIDLSKRIEAFRAASNGAASDTSRRLLAAHQVSGHPVCPEGHRHPADSNFEFCPECGGPLELQD